MLSNFDKKLVDSLTISEHSKLLADLKDQPDKAELLAYAKTVTPKPEKKHDFKALRRNAFKHGA